MIRLALDAMTGFSTAPLRWASHLSVILAFASLLLLLYIGFGYFQGGSVQGWTSTMLVVVVLSAIQMFVLGMIGEYLGRLYIESKRRPLYLVADVAGPVQGKATLGYRAEPSVPAPLPATPPAVSPETPSSRSTPPAAAAPARAGGARTGRSPRTPH